MMKLKHYKKYIQWFLFVMTPMFALMILCIVQKISPFEIDAWNTTWNDEVIYQKIVRVIHDYGQPTGICSYNEVESQYPAYGPWIFTTYIPYSIFSVLTGVNFHNFMIVENVIMIVVANIIFIFLVRPKGKQLFFLCMFSLLSIVHERYVWSGMSEASIFAMIIVVMGITLRILQNSEKRSLLLGIAAFLILFYGISRPFLLVYLLYVWAGIWTSEKSKSGKWIYSIVLFFLAITSIFLYFYLANTSTAQYFSGHGMAYFLELLQNGKFITLLKWIYQCNIDAIKVVLSSYALKKWIAFVVLNFVIELIILLIMCIKEKSKNKKIFLAASIIIGCAIYESTIILYSAMQLHRMLLGCVIGFAYIICVMFEKRVNSIYLGLQILCTVFLLKTNADSLFLPVKTENVIDYEALENSLESAVVYSEDDRWKNTVALIPVSSDLYLWYCFPSYSAFSMCTEDYLKNAITADTLKSRYIYLKEDSELSSLCFEKYPAVWSQEGYVIYENCHK